MKKILLYASLATLPVATQAQNLVFKTTFNNGMAQDISGNNFHGTVNGPTATAGYLGTPGTALHFDGVNDYVELPTNVTFNLTRWTIQAMIKPEGFYDGNCEETAIFYHGPQNSGSHYSLHIHDNPYDAGCGTNTTNEVFTAHPAGAVSNTEWQAPWYDTGSFVTENTWYCVTGTYDGDTAKIYVDGILVDAVYYPDVYNYSGNTATFIGRSNDLVSFPYWFDGIIDELSVWDEALSLADIQNNCASSTTSVGSVQQEAGIKVYPVPATNNLYVVTPQSMKNATVNVINNLGQTCYRAELKSTTTTIDISGLPSGIYFLQLHSNGTIVTEKFIKE